ncbi:MAG: hypothetical protein V3T70_03085, partial [Phycisphaerae bacterium]
MTHASDRPTHTRRQAGRRGTVLVFVIGILTMLFLIGVGLLSNVRGEKLRWQRLQRADAAPDIMGAAIELVRQRLRADMWHRPFPLSPPQDPRYLSDERNGISGDNNPTGDTNIAAENNEPFDAPGPFDRWLASTLPHIVRWSVNPSIPQPIQTGDSSNPVEQSIAWRRVSYLGSDIVENRGLQQFYWAQPSRFPFGNLNIATAATPIYGEDVNGAPLGSLNSHFADPSGFNNIANVTSGVAVLLTPPAYSNLETQFGPPPSRLGGDQIPGATTDVTIANARRLWDAGYNRSPTDANARFPYFDTNMDNVVDLYDADGDGVPDSPISFRLPYAGRGPDDPTEVYVAIRIIDNASMINVNTASPLWAPEGWPRLTFDETARTINFSGVVGALNFPAEDFQRRGRYPSDVLL